MSMTCATAASPRTSPDIDRRFSARAYADLAEVLVADPDFGTRPDNAQLEDVSAGGLCLWHAGPLPVGMRLEVGLPDTIRFDRWGEVYWMSVRVVHCEPDLLGWKVGCAFVSEPGAAVRELLDQLAWARR